MMRAFDASAGEKIASAWGRLEEEKSGLSDVEAVVDKEKF